jgi:energy-coupling factor transporter ATP-binding protein EcfA2
MRLDLCDVWAGPPGAGDAVLRGSSLGVRSGEWVAVEGPNGCGKTTLLLVAAGLRPPARGTRSLEGSAGGAPPRVATILQDPGVQLFQPTVAEEIALTALHLGLLRERIEAEVRRWSERLGLFDELGRDPRTLSAGRQQLVLVAAALATVPDFLIADEPGAHLDAAARDRVLGAIRDEVRRGMGVLWATQDSAEREAADRIVRLGGDGGASVPRMEAAPGAAEAVGGGPPVLRLDVAAWSAAEGPCVRVPQGFEITLRERGLVALTGPNGAGKSVLLACATGIADCGQVTRQWANHSSPPLLVAQYPELQIFEDVVENELAFAATRRGLGRSEALARASALLERLGLGGARFLARRTWELSAGEKRLALTVAGLIAPAGLLALDEPTAGLDRERRAALAECVRERAAAGAVLVASQDLDWVAATGARLIRLPVGPGVPSLSKKTD